jgi:hypothetical protein
VGRTELSKQWNLMPMENACFVPKTYETSVNRNIKVTSKSKKFMKIYF